MATPTERKIKIHGLRERLDSKYKEDEQKLEKQLEKLSSEEKHKQILLRKTVSDFRLLLAKSMTEAEMIAEGQSLCKTLRNVGKFDLLPAEFKADLAACFEDMKKQASATGTPGKPSSPKRGREGTQSVDAGPVPTKSSHSPMVKHKTEIAVKEKDNQRLEEMQKEMESTKKLLEDRGKELEEVHADVKRKDKMIEEKDKMIKEKDKKISDMDEECRHLAQSLEEEKLKCTNATKDCEYKQKMIQQLEHRVNECASQDLVYKKTFEDMKVDYRKLEKEKSKVEKSWQRDIEVFQNEMKEEKRKFDDQYRKLVVERDDLRDRFSKLAGAKLQEQNADIADLSDPNRAMKLSEKFGQIYDDEWTNAFECLTEKKTGLSLKDAIAFLLHLLQDCWSYCNALLAAQMESLHNVFLHPVQGLAKIEPRKHGVKDQPRVASKNDKTLRDLRRQIGVSPSVIEEVKQACLSDSKFSDKEKTGYEKKHITACAPYIQKCAEICWLMAVHDPPLYMKMEVTHGEKFDPNIYSAYSSSGNSIDFLVWPPLLNGKEGGLLAKGVAEPLRTVGKKK